MNDTTDTEEGAKDSAKEGGAEDDWAAALGEQSDAEAADADAGADWGDALNEQAEKEAADKVEQAPMQNLVDESSGPTMGDANLDVILDIPINISMQIGASKISIRNLLKLNQGSVVELDRLAGEPLDVLVNGTLIAHGEVVVVNEKYGIRLTDVISAAERIQKLK
ncbi:MAG: flagellar motor switch protein FliN [Ectothiorhodospiraceae bacterium]|nr:flagellar motor switch protein FliN [Ectothiorhodospiraceae bacterium]